MTTIDEIVPEGADPHAHAGGRGDTGRALLVLGVAEGTDAPPGFVTWLARIVRSARASGVPVVFALPDHGPERPGAAGSGVAEPGGAATDRAVHPGLEPRRGEPVVRTSASSAFAGTDLESWLRSRGVDRLGLAGQPARDLLPTATAAQDLGFGVSVLSDAVWDPEPDALRGLVDAAWSRGVDVRPSAAWLSGSAGARARSVFVPLVAALIVVVLLVSGWVWIDHRAGGYYQFSPGTAPEITSSATCRASQQAGDLALPGGKPCVRLVVPADRAHTIDGSLMMVTVLVGPASPVQFVLDKLGLLGTFEDGTQLVPKAAVLGTTPAGLLNCQDAQQMSGSTEDATVAALRRLGYDVTTNNLGALLDEVLPGSPAAAGGLQPTDLITAVNGKPITTSTSLQTAIHALRPGDVVHVTVERPVGSECTPTPKQLSVTLGSTPALGGQPARPNVAFLGVSFETQSTYTLPVGVSIEVGNIGGPSAGLALTLGLLDVLSNGSLTGGHKVAATGTIDPEGNVGDVGGVAQKTVAVRRAGAQLFLVPTVEYQTAKKEAGSHMKVEAVSTLQQALNALKAIGGHIPAPSPSASSG